MICDVLDQLRPQERSYRDQITLVKDRPGHDQRYAIDPAKIEKELGWKHSVDFTQGIRHTIEWYLANEWWWRPLRDKVYAGERMGLI